MQIAEHLEDDLFQPSLHRSGNVPVAIVQRFGRVGSGRPEQPGHPFVPDPGLGGSPAPPGDRLDLLEVPETGHVEREVHRIGHRDHSPHLRHVLRLPVRGESHHLVLVAVLVEPEVLGEAQVEPSEGVGEVDLALDAQTRSLADTPHGRDHVPDPVEGEHRRPVERGRIERAPEMGEVVFHEVELRSD